jgi:hypothetical protein
MDSFKKVDTLQKYTIVKTRCVTIRQKGILMTCLVKISVQPDTKGRILYGMVLRYLCKKSFTIL